jgi:serine protease Do
MTMKQLLLAALVSGSTIAGILYGSDRRVPIPFAFKGAGAPGLNKGDVILTGSGTRQLPTGRGPADLVRAARIAIGATVHITVRNRRAGNPFDPYAQPGNGSGSGALISQDGYLITNNHVVEGASEIRVILSNHHSFPAKMIGSDAANDLAVLKIDAEELPFLAFGDSEETRPGQWVLAAGYPMDLGTTVTAGIVSTMPSPVSQTSTVKTGNRRSLIQTDAVINHGNSGGPLVSPEGRLIGINSYFASPTGAYTGYSFAIPVSTVKKVVNRLMSHP